MKGRVKATIAVVAVLAILLIEPLFLRAVFAPEYVNGTQDDTWGVWMFSAGTTVPGGAPTDDIIERAVFYDLLDYVGDRPEEVYGFGWGTVQPTSGQEDKTLAEVILGLSSINDFGYMANSGDDDANFDTGSDGYFLGGLGFDNPYVITSDGVKATGMLGPSEAASKEEAEEAIDGYEIFIFEDAELSGMIVTLSNGFGLSMTFSLADLQVNPPTSNYADDTMVAIDLDNMTGFDGTYIDTIRIKDDSISQPYLDRGDTTLEIDAIAVRKSVVQCTVYKPAPDRLWTTDVNGLVEIEEFSIGSSVYLKTSDLPSPLVPGKYRIWLFEGNIIPFDGMAIPGGRTHLGVTPPLEVTTDSEGRFGPVKIWDIPMDPDLICNDFSVILDQLEVGLGAEAKAAPNIGKWGGEDYRDDLCTRKPTPPSFHVIPEVAFGTIVVLGCMFGGLGIYWVRRKKNQGIK